MVDPLSNASLGRYGNTALEDNKTDPCPMAVTFWPCLPNAVY